MRSKVNVKGSSGSGKTTFAGELARRLSVPQIELDALHHGPNWSEPPDHVFRARVREAMTAAPEGWVIDGNYEAKLGELVVAEADTIVWLDPPLRVTLVRLLRRTLDRILNERELWSGNRESWRGAFWGRESLFAWMIRSHFRHRRDWPARFDKDGRLVRLRSADEQRRWLESLGWKSGDRAF